MSDASPPIAYPTAYTFKVMGRQARGFEGYVRGLFGELLGAEPDADAVQAQPSRQGTYVSLSVTVTLQSEEQRRRIYARLHQDPLVVYYL
jgi:putative lipoic acid-binding regulatory protein